MARSLCPWFSAPSAECAPEPCSSVESSRRGSRGVQQLKFDSAWKITIFHGKIHYKWPFSIAMLVHQRVLIELDDGKNPQKWMI